MRLTPLVLLLFAAAVVAEEEKPTVLERLKSESAAERAWGAYLAGKEGVQDAIPLLVEAIRTVPGRKDDEGRLVLRAALDALIRLKAPVKAEILEPHLRAGFSTQALILLTRSPRTRPDLLFALFDRQGGSLMGEFGIAVGNLLCREKVPGFASRLLRHAREFELHVLLVDEGRTGGRGGSQRLGGGCGDGHVDVPEGFPPTAFYDLTAGKRDGSVLLVDGPRPIRWFRTEREGRRIGFGTTGTRIDVDVLAREWLAVLAGLPEEGRILPKSASTSLVWTDAAAYVKHVAARRDAILAGFWKFVAVLVEREALALDEARALRPVVEVEVSDVRAEPAPEGTEFPKLPAPPKRPRLPGETPEPR